MGKKQTYELVCHGVEYMVLANEGLRQTGYKLTSKRPCMELSNCDTLQCHAFLPSKAYITLRNTQGKTETSLLQMVSKVQTMPFIMLRLYCPCTNDCN